MKQFHPDRIIYIDNVPHPIEGSVRPTRMGMEIPLQPGDDPQEAWDWAEQQVNKWADERAKRISSFQQNGRETIVPYGSHALGIIDLSFEKLEIAIDNAKTTEELKSIKESNPAMPHKILLQFNKKRDELQGKRD